MSTRSVLRDTRGLPVAVLFGGMVAFLAIGSGVGYAVGKRNHRLDPQEQIVKALDRVKHGIRNQGFYPADRAGYEATIQLVDKEFSWVTSGRFESSRTDRELAIGAIDTAYQHLRDERANLYYYGHNAASVEQLEREIIRLERQRVRIASGQGEPIITDPAKPDPKMMDWPTSFTYLGSPSEHIFKDYLGVPVRVSIRREGE